MPSLEHEVLLTLLRDAPARTVELFERQIGWQAPRGVPVVADASLTALVPSERRADLVLRFGAPRRVRHLLVVEIQLAQDARKRRTWPLYAAHLHARFFCPVTLVVVTPEPRVARWAAQEIRPGPVLAFRPLVLGPEAFPRVETLSEALARPELAVLSVVAHAERSADVGMVVRALRAVGTLSPELHDACSAYMIERLSASLRGKVREAMAIDPRKIPDELRLKNLWIDAQIHRLRLDAKAEGKAEGKTAALLRLLEKRGLVAEGEALQRIRESHDEAQIDRWFDRALDATTLEDVLRD